MQEGIIVHEYMVVYDIFTTSFIWNNICIHIGILYVLQILTPILSIGTKSPDPDIFVGVNTNIWLALQLYALRKLLFMPMQKTYGLWDYIGTALVQILRNTSFMENSAFTILVLGLPFLFIKGNKIHRI